MTCSDPTSRTSSCAIRAATPYSTKAARATGSMRESCPSCCAPISSAPAITERLSELLRANLLRSVYHGENGLRAVKDLSRAYLTIGKDLTRVTNRVKAIYRGWGIPCAGKSVYHPRHREEWLRKITQASVRRRAELYYEQLDVLVVLRKQARQE